LMAVPFARAHTVQYESRHIDNSVTAASSHRDSHLHRPTSPSWHRRIAETATTQSTLFPATAAVRVSPRTNAARGIVSETIVCVSTSLPILTNFSPVRARTTLPTASHLAKTAVPLWTACPPRARPKRDPTASVLHVVSSPAAGDRAPKSVGVRCKSRLPSFTKDERHAFTHTHTHTHLLTYFGRTACIAAVPFIS
jgi:hypothetical protein